MKYSNNHKIYKLQGTRIIALISTKHGKKLAIITDFINNNGYNGIWGNGTITNVIPYNHDVFRRCKRIFKNKY